MPSSKAARPRSTRRWDSRGVDLLYFCLTYYFLPRRVLSTSTPLHSLLHYSLLYYSTILLDDSLTLLLYLPALLLYYYPVLPLGGGLSGAAQGRTQGLEANAGIGRWIAHLSSVPPHPNPPVNIHPSTPRSTRQYPSIHNHPSTNLPTSLVPPIHT